MAKSEKIKSELEKYFRVVIAPIITEKSVRPTGPKSRDENGKAVGENRPTFSFWVELHANKQQIKEAVENIFDVKVIKVQTQIVKGRTYRSRYRRDKLRYPPRKKAVVTLKEGDIIEYA